MGVKRYKSTVGVGPRSGPGTVPLPGIQEDEFEVQAGPEHEHVAV